jgi:hypothetical protein
VPASQTKYRLIEWVPPRVHAHDLVTRFARWAGKIIGRIFGHRHQDMVGSKALLARLTSFFLIWIKD